MSLVSGLLRRLFFFCFKDQISSGALKSQLCVLHGLVRGISDKAKKADFSVFKSWGKVEEKEFVNILSKKVGNNFV